MADYSATALKVSNSPYASRLFERIMGRGINEATKAERLALAKTITGATVAGAGSSMTDEFGTYVGGGAALCLGLPLAGKTIKAVGWDAPKWAWQNRCDYSGAINKIKDARNMKAAETKAFAKSLKGNSIWQTCSNLNQYAELKDLNKKYSVNTNPTEKQKCFQQAVDKIADIKKQVKAGNLKGKALKDAIKEVKELIRQGELAFQEGLASGTIKKTSKIGRAWQSVKNGTGLSKLSVGLTKAAAKSTAGASVASKAGTYAARGAKNFAKGGGGITAAIMLACDAPEIYNTYKELGAGAGTKQLGKSATVAVAAGVGWVVGAKAGTLLGTKIGAAIGACFGGVGAAPGAVIGAVLGCIGGLACSFFAEKGARKLMGKSELEKAKDKKAEELAKNENKEKLATEGIKAAQEGGLTELQEIETLEKVAIEMNLLADDAYSTSETQEDAIKIDTSLPEIDYSQNVFVW